MLNAYDIVVVGAGPAGSFTAQRAAAKGLRVLLLEDHPKVGEPRHCTGVLGREAYDRYPALPREPIQASLHSAWIVSPAGERVRANWFDGQAFVIDRTRFDRQLADEAVRAGAELRTSCAAEAIEVHPTCVVVSLADRASGRTECVEAQAVVIATGVANRLHGQAGLEPPETYLYCAQTEAHSDFFKDVEVYIGREVAPGSFAWAVPLGDGRVRVGVTAHRMAAAHLEKLLTTTWLKGKITYDPARIVKRPVPIDPVACSVSDRVLLVGDAAGQVKPTTGGGIYYGLVGAELAAETLAHAAAAGNFGRDVLMEYDRAWRRLLGAELRKAAITRKVFEWFKDERLDRLVKVCQHEQISKLIQKQAVFDWHSRALVSFLTSPRVLWQLF